METSSCLTQRLQTYKWQQFPLKISEMVHNTSHTCQLPRISWETPRYSTNLLVSGPVEQLLKVQGLVTTSFEVWGGGGGGGGTKNTKFFFLIIVTNSKFISYVGMAVLFVAVY